jgi:hypothetical protein
VPHRFFMIFSKGLEFSSSKIWSIKFCKYSTRTTSLFAMWTLSIIGQRLSIGLCLWIRIMRLISSIWIRFHSRVVISQVSLSKTRRGSKVLKGYVSYFIQVKKTNMLESWSICFKRSLMLSKSHRMCMQLCLYWSYLPSEFWYWDFHR